MLLCFGASWPFAIYKSYTSGQVGSKCLVFLLLILAGYGAGICYKYQTHTDWVLGIYLFIFAMVTSEVVLYIRNTRRSRFRPMNGVSHFADTSGPRA
jgi:hypothetical protein